MKIDWDNPLHVRAIMTYNMWLLHHEAWRKHHEVRDTRGQKQDDPFRQHNDGLEFAYGSMAHEIERHIDAIWEPSPELAYVANPKCDRSVWPRDPFVPENIPESAEDYLVKFIKAYELEKFKQQLDQTIS